MTSHSAVLKDGSTVLIRQVHSTDAALLAEGFAQLSAQSRWFRFLTGKPHLTAAELRYFTEIDHHDHEALGALDPVDGRGLGVARYIRHAEDPEGAEVAVTVVDEWQGRGLATELLRRLVDRARQEGIRHFTALVAADNAAVVALLHDNPGGTRVTHRESGAIEYEIPLPARGIGDELYALLRAFGRRQVKAPGAIQDTLGSLIPEKLTNIDPTSDEVP